MRYLSLAEVIELHRRIVAQSGGASEIRELAGIESALAQPQMTFASQELYPTIAAKAAAICFSLVMNHPFVDGNKRIGHAAMETFLLLNGFEIKASVENAEQTFLRLAAGELTREALLRWVESNIHPIT